MPLADPASFLIRLLLMLLVVSMIRIEDISKLADFVPRMRELDLGIVEVCMLQFVPEMREFAMVLLMRPRRSISLPISGHGGYQASRERD